ncbi:hypothetical protein [Ramlibacter rhizophilus]|uniref:Uncharacterized protein n=1 Tax=Ramlibacter rhizophilus TaxID=1781167 RepID=A0A4Z0BZ47_9BURK|nr:hypothetical protein [Ramlibacter rhizophilus]TFZ04493.1 hypothetical protein EZ242_01715 [Ramlibacter rhizophilus]
MDKPLSPMESGEPRAPDERWTWAQEVRAGIEPWQHPGNWLGSAVVIVVVVAIGLTIWPGWDRIFAVLGQ